MAKNKLKNEVEEPKQKAPKGESLQSKLKQQWANKNVRIITGIAFMFLAGFLFAAIVSYFFTWKQDQDKILNGWFSLLTNTDVRVDNWFGKIGAIASHLLMHTWFGISSLGIVVFTFALGFRITFKTNILPLRATLKHVLFHLIWLSAFFGVLFNESMYYMGGTLGYSINLWLTTTIGRFGAFGIVLFASLAYLITTFNLNKINFLEKFFSPTTEQDSNLENTADEEPEVLKNTFTSNFEDMGPPEETTPSPQPDQGRTNSEPSSNTNLDELTPPEDETVEDFSGSIVLDASVPEKSAAIEPDDDDFEIEIPQEEEPVELVSESEDSAEEELELTVSEVVEDDLLSKRQIKNLVDEFGEYDPRLDLPKFKFPSIDYLQDHGESKIQINKEELETNKHRIVETLNNYNINIQKIKATVGPTVTLYEIVPAPGVRISKIKNLEDDIALSLAALGIRIIAPIPGKGTIGIEVPNSHPEVVPMRTMVQSSKFQNSDMELPIVLGKTISNETFTIDLAKMPHLLMAGATGQGKSVGLNTILVSLLYKKHPSEIKFVLVDPKKVELTLFNKIERHYLAKLPDSDEPIITDTSKVVNTLNSLCIEMDQRYEILKEAHCRNIKEYNAKFKARKLNPEKGHKFLPYIVLVIDEFADLIMTAGKEVETPIARLAQLARAIGIHLIIATQRPSVNIITGLIKANFPTRIAFRVTAKIDSRTILDTGGADQLIGRGDMLLASGSDLIRIQCAFVDTPEVEEICEHIGNQQGYADAFLLPEYLDESGGGNESLDDMEKDALFEEAARLIVISQSGSASLLQRKLKLGYNRAGRLIDQLEIAGIVGPNEGSKARQVLIPDEISLEQKLEQIR